MPSPDTIQKENATLNSADLNRAAQRKVSVKKRSKSIEPGGLDALKEATGNSRNRRTV